MVLGTVKVVFSQKAGRLDAQLVNKRKYLAGSGNRTNVAKRRRLNKYQTVDIMAEKRLKERIKRKERGGGFTGLPGRFPVRGRGQHGRMCEKAERKSTQEGN